MLSMVKKPQKENVILERKSGRNGVVVLTEFRVPKRETHERLKIYLT